MTTPLISIIIPTFNRASLISQTLDSVKNQVYANWECIIIDDGSVDETENIVKKYIADDERFSYCQRPDHFKKGGNGARNFGFTKSKGEFINWFDSDDVMLPNFLLDKISAFNDNTNLVICNALSFNDNNDNRKLMKIRDDKDFYFGLITWRLQIVTNSVMFKKSFLEDKELFSEKIHRGQETELFARLFFQLPTDQYEFLDHPLFLYRQHSSSKTSVSKIYNPLFSESKMYINLAGLSRNIKANDKYLKTFYYRTLVKLLFVDLKNRNKQNVTDILDKTYQEIKNYNVIAAGLFFFIGKLAVRFPQLKFIFEPLLKALL